MESAESQHREVRRRDQSGTQVHRTLHRGVNKEASSSASSATLVVCLVFASRGMREVSLAQKPDVSHITAQFVSFHSRMI